MTQKRGENGMRTTRSGAAVVVGAAILVAVLVVPGVAQADGGAYIEFDETYYLPGDGAVGTAYVSVPKTQEAILDRGPFMAFLLPRGVTTLQAGRAIPNGAIQLGTFTIHEEKDSYELEVRFTVPEVPGGFYNVGVCNDPCTVAGFKEPLSGSIGIVATVREAQLLKENGTLQSKIWGLQRDLRKSGKQMDELRAEIDDSRSATDLMAARVGDLQGRLADADALVASESLRPIIPPWAAALVAFALLVLAGTLLVRWRRPRRKAPVRSAPAPADPEIA
jgi:hypothetical protein